VSERAITPDLVTPPNTRRVEVAKARLVVVTASESATTAARRFDRVMDRASQSLEHMEATFRAAQALRDVGTIDQAEAAHIFSGLYSVWEEVYEKNDPVTQKLLSSHIEEIERAESTSQSREASINKHLDRLLRRGRELESIFHRVRGEISLSHMILENQEQYRDLCTAGEASLLHAEDFLPDTDVAAEPDAQRVALITERIISLAATETGRETLRAWHAFAEAELAGDAASSVAAVQRVRELGLVSADEAVGLMDTVLTGVMSTAIEVDRECARLQRAIDAVRARHGLDHNGRLPNGAEHPEWTYLDRQRERRGNGIMADCLRRFGEHRSANLLVENPAEYDRLVNEVSVGAWGRPE
jgi:hypothetical protein